MPAKKLSDEAVRMRAYEIYQARAGPGDPADDWAAAEQELRSGPRTNDAHTTRRKQAKPEIAK